MPTEHSGPAVAPGPAVTAAPDLLVRTENAAYPLRSGAAVRIGRDPASDIVLADQHVSWTHAVLRTDGDTWVFEDLGSSKGSFLDAERTDRIEIAADCDVRLGLAGRELPAQGALLKSLPLVELLIAVAVLAVASMCLGLLVSAFVSTSEKAMPFMVMLTMIQIILSGGVLPLGGVTGLAQLSWIAPARWGFAAVASTVNLNAIGLLPGASPDALWAHTEGDWARDIGVTAGLAAVCLLITWIQLRRLGPRRRR